jgi:cell division septal protein FtsQ
MATKKRAKAPKKPSYQSLFVAHKNLTWLLPIFAVGVLVFLYVLVVYR